MRTRRDNTRSRQAAQAVVGFARAIPYPLPALRAHAADVTGQVVAAVLAVARRDVVAVTLEQIDCGRRENQERYPQRNGDPPAHTSGRRTISRQPSGSSHGISKAHTGKQERIELRDIADMAEHQATPAEGVEPMPEVAVRGDPGPGDVA